MGLFKKRKAAIKRAKAEYIHEIVCLYCFQNFSHDQVLFRAAKVIDAEGYRAEVDHALDGYRYQFHMGTAGELPAAISPGEFSEANKGYVRGILSSLKDDYGNVSASRLCPYCHNIIPPGAGFSPSTIISFVGASQAGKSVYLTSLIHTLKTVTSHNFDVFCTPITNEVGWRFKYDYEDPLIENGHLLDPTQKERLQEPLIFTFSFADGGKPEINIAFFDVAGEGMVDSGYMDIFAAHIRNSSGVMFLVDPQQFKAIGRKVQLMNHLDYDISAASEPMEVLSGLVENYIHKQHSGISDIPTAMVLTKSDLLTAMGYEGGYLRQNSRIFSRYNHREFFNLTEARIVGYEVDDFIRTADPNFRNALTRRFARLGLFAVSALGAHPDVVHKRVANFAPIRVDEPFLWILYQLGFIDGAEVV